MDIFQLSCTEQHLSRAGSYLLIVSEITDLGHVPVIPGLWVVNDENVRLRVLGGGRAV